MKSANVLGKRGISALPAILSVMWIGTQAWGFGLGIPGLETGTNFYYSIEGTKLYRYICPPGVVPTAETCTQKDPGFLIGYSVVHNSISQAIKDELEQTSKQIKQEVLSLKEADPQVQKMRATIRNELASVGNLEKMHSEMLQTAEKLTANLQTVDSQLAAIVAKLATDLSQEELLRTIEIHTERETQKKKFDTDLKKLQADIALTQTQIAQAKAQVSTVSVQLAKYLPTLVVQSAKLIELQETKTSLEAQMELLPELDKRLRDPLAYPLDAWIATGTPGVEPLTNRFLEHALRLARGEVVSRKQPN